jgi:excisionase family DNA binding protein
MTTKRTAYVLPTEDKEQRHHRQGGHVNPPLMYRVPEAAEALRISRSHLYELIRSGQVRSVTVGRARRISHAALTDYISHLEEDAA